MHAFWQTAKSRWEPGLSIVRQGLASIGDRIRYYGDPLLAWLLPRLTARRRTYAVMFSLALHLLFILALLPHARTFGLTGGGSIGNGSGVGDGVSVELFDGGLPKNSDLKVKAPEPEDTEDLTTMTVAAVDDLNLADPVLSDVVQPMDQPRPDTPQPQTTASADSAAHRGATGTGGRPQAMATTCGPP